MVENSIDFVLFAIHIIDQTVDSIILSLNMVEVSLHLIAVASHSIDRPLDVILESVH